MTATRIFKKFEKTLKEEFPKKRNVKVTLYECYIPELDDKEKWDNNLKDLQYRDDVKVVFDPYKKYMTVFEKTSTRSKQYNFIILNLTKPIFYVMIITSGVFDESRKYLNPFFTSGRQAISNFIWKLYPEYTYEEVKLVEKSLSPEYQVIECNISMEDLLVDDISIYEIFTQELNEKEMEEKKRQRESIEWADPDDIESLVLFAFLSYSKLYNPDTTQQSLIYETSLLAEYINELTYRSENPRDLRKKDFFYDIALRIFFERASYRDMYERNSEVKNDDEFIAILDCNFTDAFCLATSRITVPDILDMRKNESNMWTNIDDTTLN